MTIGVAGVRCQGLADVELRLSEAVTQWQNSAAKLDKAVIDLQELQARHTDLMRVRDWMESNLQSRMKQNESSKSIKKARKVYSSGVKKVKEIGREIDVKQKEINELTEEVEEQKQRMSKLSFQRESLINTDNRNAKKVYSGYFPKYKSFYHADKADDVLLNPVGFSCEKAFDGTDPRLKKHRIEYVSKQWFTYQPKMLPLINGKPYLVCNSYFTLVEGGQYFLNLEVLIYSQNHRQSFGYLERWSRLFITFLNGEELILQNNLLNLGSFNKKKGLVTFRGQYPLSVYAQNRIKKHGIDKIRIEWAKGYEDYEIYYVDLLQQQLKCL